MQQHKRDVNQNNFTARADQTRALVALGSNAGDPHGMIAGALAALRAKFPNLTQSQLYQTPAFPAGSGPDFINAAVAFDTDLAPSEILALLHRIEDDFGRTRVQRWGQRTLDLDLIAKGDAILPDLATYAHWRGLPLARQKTETPDTLILPHPRVQDRSFVLIPLGDVAPDWVHPHLNRSIADLITDHSPDQRAQIRPL